MIDKLIELGNINNIKIEVLKTTDINNYIKVFNSKLETFTLSNNIYYDIKSLYKDKVLELRLYNLNDLEKIICSIKRAYEISDNTEKTDFAKPIDIKQKNLKSLNLNMNEIKEYLSSLDKYKKEFPYLKTIISYFEYFKSEKEIKNEETSLYDGYQYINLYIELVAKNGNKIETEGLNIFSNTLNKEELEKKLREKLIDLNDKLNSITPDSIKTSVLLTNEAVYSILDSFIDMFYAKSIRLKTSPLSGKLDTKIFSDKISIIEDPDNEEMIVSKLFDDEGTKTNYKEIVKDGIFKNILYNNNEAILADKESTGNSDGVTNCYIKPGEKSFDELIKTMNDGIIINGFDGLHAGVKILTGEISLKSEGYIVKNGKKANAIKMFVMTTNIFELLSNVIEVGNDLEFFEESGGCPSILIENINISGN